MQDIYGAPTVDELNEPRVSRNAAKVSQGVLHRLLNLTWPGELQLTSSERDVIDTHGGPDNYGEWEAHCFEVETEKELTDSERQGFIYWSIVRLALRSLDSPLRTICRVCGEFIAGVISENRFEILCERAEFKLIPHGHHPSPHNRYIISEPDNATYRPHVLGARLLIWCAAAQDPKSFDFDQGLFGRLSALKIWASRIGNKVFTNPKPVELIQEAAKFIVDRANDDNSFNAPSETTSLRPGVKGKPRSMEYCGLGHDGEHWHVFLKVKGHWRHHGRFQSKIQKGIQSNFLKLLLENPKGLEQSTLLNRTYESRKTREEKLRGLRKSVTPAISRLRTVVREELKIGQSDPFPCNDHAWHSKLVLGKVFEDDRGKIIFQPSLR